MNRNCPNCGAPYDINVDTCPYCKTSYFDLSAIDITKKEPFYLKIRVDGGVFTTKVYVPDVSIEVHDEYVNAVDCGGHLIRNFVANRTCNISMKFESVRDKAGTLYKYVADC